MEKVIETLFNGLSMGAVYAMIALAFVLVYKATDILNFANGELVMLGAFLCYTFATLLELPLIRKLGTGQRLGVQYTLESCEDRNRSRNVDLHRGSPSPNLTFTPLEPSHARLVYGLSQLQRAREQPVILGEGFPGDAVELVQLAGVSVES